MHVPRLFRDNAAIEGIPSILSGAPSILYFPIEHKHINQKEFCLLPSIFFLVLLKKESIWSITNPRLDDAGQLKGKEVSLGHGPHPTQQMLIDSQHKHNKHKAQGRSVAFVEAKTNDTDKELTQAMIGNEQINRR